MSDHSSAGNDTIIHLDRVSKRYSGQDQAAVSPLTMKIKAGEFVVFVGPSGCGKTTTLRMINRLVEPSAGQIWINGDNVTRVDANQLRRGIGYVIQQIGLLPHLTIADNIGLVPKLLGTPKSQRRRRAEELLDLVGLDPRVYARRYPRQLSGSQQQRVGVARALAADPPIMLMDEPFGAIDPIARKKLQVEFLNLQAKIRKTIVFVTHDIGEALRLGDRIAIFDSGSRLAQFDTPLNILTDPADDFVRDFVGSGAPVRRLLLLPVPPNLAHTNKDSNRVSLHNAIQVAPHDTIHHMLEQVLSAKADGVCLVTDPAADADRAQESTTYISLQDLLVAAAHTEQATRTRHASIRWIAPVVAVTVVAGALIYTTIGDLDSSEIRSLELPLILQCLSQHVALVAVSTALTIGIGVSLGVLLTRRRTRYLAGAVLAVANAGQAIPSIGLLVLLAIVFGVGFKMAVVALATYALLPALRNTMVGIRQVDAAIIDAGRGMGMNAGELLRTIELPLALPVMLAGIRVALILNVGAATLVTYTNACGLGSIIAAGIHLNRLPVLVVGSALTIALALAVDWIASVAEQLLRPKGI